MRAVSVAAGVLLIVIGLVAVVTGDAVLQGPWAFVLILAALGIAGLVSAATAVAR